MEVENWQGMKDSAEHLAARELYVGDLDFLGLYWKISWHT